MRLVMTLHLKPSQTNQPSTEGDLQKLKPSEKPKMQTSNTVLSPEDLAKALGGKRAEEHNSLLVRREWA